MCYLILFINSAAVTTTTASVPDNVVVIVVEFVEKTQIFIEFSH